MRGRPGVFAHAARGRQALVTALAIAAVACSGDATGPQTGRSLQTDRAAYVAQPRGGVGPGRYGFSVVATFRNTTSATLYLGRCEPDSPTPMYGVELVDGPDPEGAAYDPGWACVGHDQQFVLQPGQVRTDTLQLSGPTAVDGHTLQPLGALEGTFRLHYAVATASGDGAPAAPDSIGVSNPFTVRLQ